MASSKLKAEVARDFRSLAAIMGAYCGGIQVEIERLIRPDDLQEFNKQFNTATLQESLDAITQDTDKLAAALRKRRESIQAKLDELRREELVKHER